MNEIDRMLDENKGLVYLYLRRLGNGSSSFIDDDFVQIGMIGLWKACESFDESKGFTFSTYATRCIKNEISLYLRYQNKLNRYDPLSLDELRENFADTDKTDLYNYIPSASDIDDTQDNVEQFVRKLTDTEKVVLQCSLNGKTRQQTAIRLGCTVSRVSQLCQKIARKAKREFNIKEDVGSRIML